MTEKESSWVDTLYENVGWKDILSFGLDGISTIGKSFSDATDLTTKSSQNKMRATIAGINAQRGAANIDVITRTYEQQLNEQMLASKQTKAKLKTEASASGFEVDSGSYIDIENQLDEVTRKNTAALFTAYQFNVIENKYQSEIAKIQSDLYKKQAEYELRAAKTARTTGIISGLGQIGAAAGLAFGKDAYLNKGKDNG